MADRALSDRSQAKRYLREEKAGELGPGEAEEGVESEAEGAEPRGTGGEVLDG